MADAAKEAHLPRGQADGVEEVHRHGGGEAEAQRDDGVDEGVEGQPRRHRRLGQAPQIRPHLRRRRGARGGRRMRGGGGNGEGCPGAQVHAHLLGGGSCSSPFQECLEAIGRISAQVRGGQGTWARTMVTMKTKQYRGV